MGKKVCLYPISSLRGLRSILFKDADGSWCDAEGRKVKLIVPITDVEDLLSRGTIIQKGEKFFTPDGIPIQFSGVNQATGTFGSKTPFPE